MQQTTKTIGRKTRSKQRVLKQTTLNIENLTSSVVQSNHDAFFMNLNRTNSTSPLIYANSRVETIDLDPSAVPIGFNESPNMNSTPNINLTTNIDSTPYINSTQNFNLTTNIDSTPNINLTPNMNSAPIEMPNSLRCTSSNSFENAMIDYMKEIMLRLTAIEKHVAKLDCRLVNLKTEGDVLRPPKFVCSKLGSSDINELQKLGLPVNSLDALNTLEENLKKESFVQAVVIYTLKKRIFWNVN